MLLKALASGPSGNPLFLEESVRTLVETGALVGERGAYRLTRPVEQLIQIPATVQAILAARIDRLAPEDKRLLQAAAVIGKDVPLPLLRRDRRRDRRTRLRAELRTCRRRSSYTRCRLFPDLEYTFKHALTHEVAYGSLLHGPAARPARPHRRGPGVYPYRRHLRSSATPGPPRRWPNARERAPGTETKGSLWRAWNPLKM